MSYYVYFTSWFPPVFHFVGFPLFLGKTTKLPHGTKSQSMQLVFSWYSVFMFDDQFDDQFDETQTGKFFKKKRLPLNKDFF